MPLSVSHLRRGPRPSRRHLRRGLWPLAAAVVVVAEAGVFLLLDAAPLAHGASGSRHAYRREAGGGAPHRSRRARPSYFFDRLVSMALSRAVAVVAAEWPTLLPRAAFATWSAVFWRVSGTLGLSADDADGGGGNTADGGGGGNTADDSGDARSSSNRDWYA